MLICYYAYWRILAPPKVQALPMLIIAVIGLLVNLICARILWRSESNNLNIRGALLHVLGDALGSVGAILAGITMLLWQWYLTDPIISIFVALLILYSSWRLLKDCVDILLESTPAHVDIKSMERELARVDGVASIHDLHVWSITSGLLSMSCHAVLNGSRDRHELLRRLNAILRSKFFIHHSTIQFEETSLEHEELNTCH
jgi:cobalt-zinc-cadmium efflux system protein